MSMKKKLDWKVLDNPYEETYARLAAGDKDAIMHALMLIMDKMHSGQGIPFGEIELKRIRERAKEIRLMRAHDSMMGLPR